MNRLSTVARLTRAAAVAAVIATTGLSLGLGPAAAAPAAAKPGKPDLLEARLRTEPAAVGQPMPMFIDFVWVDRANNEEGFELIGRVVAPDNAINVTTKTLPGALAGIGNQGRGTLDQIKGNTRYCFSVRAYQLKTLGDTYGDKSNEICLTTPLPVQGQPLPADPAATTVSRASAEYVNWVQAALNTVDGANMPVDGDFGPVTDRAVRNFQAGHGLTVDGIVGPLTEKALVAAGAPNPPGTSRTGVAKMP